MNKDFEVTITLTISADNPKEAFQFALDDLRDKTLSPWQADVFDFETNETTLENNEAD